MVSRMDDYPVHQIAQPIRYPVTSDRNFYDRYYFNMHNCSDELMAIFGMGQYPNLGTQDAFVLVRHLDEHRTVRASRELGDRMDTSVGPIRIEVLEGLRRLRVVADAPEHGIEMDVTWDAACPAVLEGNHFRRQFDRISIDTSRFAQLGRWSGSLRSGGKDYKVTPDKWWGCRDRSWGVRPVGEPEPPGIRAKAMQGGAMGRAGFFWNYFQMQFDDYSIVSIIEENADGSRGLSEATKVWKDPGRPLEDLGRPDHKHEFKSGTRTIERSTITFTKPSGEQATVIATPLLPVYLMLGGTGYGGGEWGHGVYHGELEVGGEVLDVKESPERFQGFCDANARFENDGNVGYGLFEYMVAGAHEKYGFQSFTDVAK